MVLDDIKLCGRCPAKEIIEPLRQLRESYNAVTAGNSLSSLEESVNLRSLSECLQILFTVVQ